MAPAPINIIHDLSKTQQLQVSKLYFEAFQTKFTQLMGLPEDPEIAGGIFAEALIFDVGRYAEQSGKILGGIALVTGEKPFVHVTVGALRQHFPFFGAVVRAAGYWLLEVTNLKPKQDEVLIDALFVSGESRGMGIGTRLLQHAEEYTRSIGRTKLILGVIDSNDGAKRLYERFGYEVFKYERTGIFTASAGFRGAYAMRKVLD